MEDDFLITEKGIADEAWCPVLWMEPTGASKRIKPERNWDPLEEIQEAIAVGTRNKRVFIEDTALGRKAIPYGDEFWLNIPFGEGKFLITCKEVMLEPLMGSTSTISMIRSLRYDPRTEETLAGEKHLLTLICYHLRKVFPSAKASYAKTVFPSASTLEIKDPDTTAVVAARAWGKTIGDHASKREILIPRLDRCPRCWFTDCGSRQVPPQDKNPVVKMNPGQFKRIASLD